MSDNQPRAASELPTDHAMIERLVRRNANHAGEAIRALWDEQRGTFWRSTTHRTLEETTADPDRFFPTASLRCMDALLSLTVDFPDWASPDFRKRVGIFVRRVVSRDHDTLDTSLNLRGEGLNLFTLALYVQAFSRICTSGLLQNVRTRAATIAKLKAAVTSLFEHTAFLRPAAGNRIESHPFLLYHACRAIGTFLQVDGCGDPRPACEELLSAINSSIRGSVEKLVAKSALSSLNPSESVVLAFCAGTLALSMSGDDLQYIRTATELCFRSQDDSGCWPLGRIVREDKTLGKEEVVISTYEIAGVVAEALTRLAQEADEHLTSGWGNEIVQRLIRAGRYTESSAVRLVTGSQPRLGWCNDHAYGKEEIQSWTCATVLQSLLNLADLVEEFDRQTILATFVHIPANDPDRPSWRRWEKYRTEGEVDSERKVLTYVHEKIITPVLTNPRRLPSRNPSSVSVLLFGPPGTSKTTIVKAAAEGLRWPVVLLSPGDFIERGLEYIEAQAKSVFDRLMNVSRTVVIFDECDELFRDRTPRPESEQTRGITAFVTASMLPKLQELHDRGRIVFFICTNNFDTIDSAIRRGGRIDHIIGIGPPDEPARGKIADLTVEEFKGHGKPALPARFEVAKKRLVARAERFTRSEVQRAIRLLLLDSEWTTDAEAEKAADQVVQRMSGSLTISDQEYQSFAEQNQTYSHAVTERRNAHV